MSRHRRGRRRRLRPLARLWGILTAVIACAAAVIFIPILDIGPRQQADESEASSFASLDPPPQTEIPEAGSKPSIEPPTDQGTELEIPAAGDGIFRPAAGESLHEHTPGGSQTSYNVEVESELSFDPATAAAQIETILDDPRGWRTVTGRELHRVPDQGELRVLLATPGTTDRLCAPLKTNGRVSCRNGDLIVLNARRWAFGIDDYDDVDQYRTYLVNHEFGHALGYGHAECPGQGMPAPVMQQQTYGLNGCRANVWPTVG